MVQKAGSVTAEVVAASDVVDQMIAPMAINIVQLINRDIASYRD